MKISDVVNDIKIVFLDYKKKPELYQMSRDMTSVVLFLLSQRAIASTQQFDYSGDILEFYKQTHEGLVPFINQRVIHDKAPAAGGIVIDGPLINKLYRADPIVLDTNYTGIFEFNLPTRPDSYTSNFTYARGMISKFISALQVHCKTGIFVSDLSLPLLKSAPEKYTKAHEWNIYEDNANPNRFFIFVPAELMEKAKEKCPRVISDITPAYVLDKCTKIRETLATTRKVVSETW